MLSLKMMDLSFRDIFQYGLKLLLRIALMNSMKYFGISGLAHLRLFAMFNTSLPTATLIAVIFPRMPKQVGVLLFSGNQNLVTLLSTALLGISFLKNMLLP